jgi:serine/threonine-protein kinase
MAETNELHELGSSFGLLAILGRTLLARETGLLLCEHGKVRKEVYVTEGVPSFVTSNRPGDLLGEHLVKEGVIERGELDLALAVMPRFEGHLGDTLIALGLVEPIHLVRHIARKVEDKLVELFTWTAGRVAFYRSASPPEGGFPLGLDPWAVLLDGAEARRQHGLDPAKRAALSEMPLKRTDVITPAVAQAVEPPRALVTVLDALERPRTAGQLARQLSLRADDLERQLAVLLAMDAIRLHEGNVARSD